MCDLETARSIPFGTFVPFQLKDKDSKQLIFKGLAGKLLNDQSLRAYVIIRSEFLGVKEAEVDDAEKVTEEEIVAAGPAAGQILEPDEVPDADPARLVEKWKGELLKLYGIGENRLVVMIAPARSEYRVGEMEAWIVPNGVALPDPAEAEGTETSET